MSEPCECGHDTPTTPEIDAAIQKYYEAAYDYGKFREWPSDKPGWRYCSFREHFAAAGKLRKAITAAMAVKTPEVGIGTIARCDRGRVGVITGRKELPWGESWVGVGVDDGTEWASRNPTILSIEEIAALPATKKIVDSQSTD